MSNGLRKHIRIYPVCHRCNKNGGKHYLIYKDGYGWVCPECGYEKPVKEWKESGAKL
jgi:translation initiation factor 2 beta subunit (eIF-2beta)/eIF-5